MKMRITMTQRALAVSLLILTIAVAVVAEAPPQPRSDWSSDTTVWSSGTYAYDGSGNIKQIGNDIYRYDPLGRLAEATAGTAPATSAVPPINRQVFAYDQFGNLKTITTTMRDPQIFVRGFAVNAATNQLDGQCEGQPDACLAAIYDPAGSGNQVGLDTQGQYTWDALGMMTMMAHRGELYVYDANDERIVTIDTVHGSTARYTLRGIDGKVARELTFIPSTNTWFLTKDYVYRAGALVASFSSTQTEPDRHYHLDHLGSTRLVTDGTGHRLATHTYWPFGLEADGSEADSERLKFTGHERDSSPDGFVLDYMHARYYNPNLGRFLTVDPGPVNPARPQTWNRYSYVLNQPVNFHDATGAYRTDFHHDLTRLIALAAGYGPNEAAEIAAMTELPDHDGRDPESVANYDDRAAYHFVDPRRLRALEIDAATSGPAQTYWIGSYLHALQDSYSHAGFGPGIGHIGPILRGIAVDALSMAVGTGHLGATGAGYKKAYDVDTTSDRPLVALDAARATYNALVRFNHGNAKVPFHAISGLIEGYLSSEENSAARKFYQDNLCKRLGCE